MVAAGILEQRVRFERQQAAATDAFGNTLTPVWVPLFTAWASFRPETGRENLQSGRLEATLRGTLRLRASADARGLTAADRAVFVAGRYVGLVCQIRTTPMRTPDGSSIELVLEQGVAS